MPFRGETSLYERLTFLWLWSAGLSVRSVARHTGRSPHTVRRWLRWFGQYRRLLKPMDGQLHRLLPAASSGDKELLFKMAACNRSALYLALFGTRRTIMTCNALPLTYNDNDFVQSETIHENYSTCCKPKLMVPISHIQTPALQKLRVKETMKPLSELL